MTPLPLLLLVLLIGAAPAPASASTLAVSGGASPTVCGVAAVNGTVYCEPLSGAANSSASAVAPYIAFAEVSAGRGFVCGLRAGGAALFCWPPAAPGQLRRVYNGPAALEDLAVGADHVAAYDEAARRILWWRGGGRFPAYVDGGFRSLVSGDGFSCAVETNSSGAVRCWGPRGSAVQTAFANASAVSYLAAGGTRACGLEASGAVLCSGSGSANSSGAVPRDLYLYGLAVGDSHACGLRRPNHTAVCWSLGGPTTTVYYPAYGTAFEFLVADGNLTCGLVTADFTVLCWSSTDLVATQVPLQGILPGVCVRNESSCACDYLPQSELLCAGSGGGVICDRLCDISPPPTPISPPPSSTPPPAPSRRGVPKGWIAFAVVGAVGAFAGLCSIVYCFVFGFCSNKRVHNSVQPNIASTAAAPAADDDNNNNNGGASSPYGSPNGSRARGLFRRQLSRVMTRQRSGPSSFKDQAEEFTFAQLEAATKGFALEAKIGEGSFGTVYRGKLPDGREVAIKRGESGPRARRFQEKESAFRSELAFLSRLHHKHLVGLVGYCEENEERLLVYEYMKNGALYDHLHPKSPPSPPSPVASSWKLRIKILLDASRGIEYLHSYAVPPIIHRDIKSSNILLDGGWTARVSDFGLSLMDPEAEEAQGHLTVKAAGTVGYMDPEYYGLHHLTVKSDVYGFGVVTLEVLTGKRAIFKEAEGGNPVSVVDYAVPSIVAGELCKVLDARAPEPAADEAEAVELVAYTAVHCVRLEGKDRPAMADIVANLETAFALCEGSAGDRGGGGFGNSSSSASLSITSMDDREH
ncbi:putative serine/threonine-protein kinase-like protein CCR3 [Phragmites australis]|uniref:putative serine/threonine-protein kinase-like protein CCR3 n=1 Tax=Phragmites australis TaxID=29695 RepID=UPI002D79AA76|nr:putative serine/threonine-protein kinase-like protein CCR3 [Phragmites australis]